MFTRAGLQSDSDAHSVSFTHAQMQEEAVAVWLLKSVAWFQFSGSSDSLTGNIPSIH